MLYVVQLQLHAVQVIKPSTLSLCVLGSGFKLIHTQLLTLTHAVLDSEVEIS